MSNKNPQAVKPLIAVIGGGVAGATAAVHLGELGQQVLLVEKGPGLVNGPPICHLHAGGNLYREISEQQCIELLRQSLETIRLYPHTLNKRPTVIAVPHSDPGQPQDIVPRLEVIRSAYQQLVDEDARNKLLGEPDQYFCTYQREELEAIANKTQPINPQTLEDWLIPVVQNVDLDAIKYPLIAVQEYGWSVFRLGASAELALARMPNCDVRLSTTVIDMQYVDGKWLISLLNHSGETVVISADYVINACGYQTGSIDDMAKHYRHRLVEFKAAYVTHWQDCCQSWPEVIFHGPRGTPQGMAQLTPYADGVFQLHGMTEGITLFKDGLVSSDLRSAQPKLPSYLAAKLNQGWSLDAQIERTGRAIDHMSQFVPSFVTADIAGKPLFGAQQIPGEDATLRAADVSFEDDHYARIEIVKGSSALEAIQKIVATWQLADVDQHSIELNHPISLSLTAQQVEEKALQMADDRGYPQALAKVLGMP
ncbi:FAD-dependent oxidoreductase [Vibrio sp. CAIM 722]|uniref:FAD-dependent oxidoreductase n=1 Tax=Vibrio eleionomae TaxID=2653505 RepID=A0A7X4RW24_9VIBR|nr:FAD-dependent oxidoreductase [Vibrio eleionomae]MZI95168.1 FAD-dependent oxidoreductase [Vibrio eleionomae]